MAEESDEEFTDRVIAVARARRGDAGDGSSLDVEVGAWMRTQRHDPEVPAALTPAELEQVSKILRCAVERRKRGGR